MPAADDAPISIPLHVLAGNDDATRFYERHGFRAFATWMRAG